jgi:hypothetical protein
MSGTTDEPAQAIPSIPNYSSTPRTETVNGVAEQWFVVKYGENQTDAALPDRILEIRKVDMGDQFDLAEIAGDQTSNDVWLSLAIVGMSVQKIDGVPVPRGNVTKASLRSVLKQIGPLGVRAVRRAVFDMAAPDGKPVDEKAAAGN